MEHLSWFIDDSEIEKLAISYLKQGKILDIEVHKDKHTLYAKDLLIDEHQIIAHRHGRYKDIYLHNHDYYELEYVLKGEITTTIDGHSHTLRAGSLLLLNPNCYHDFKAAGNEDTLVNIVIKKDIISQYLSLFKSNSQLSEFLTTSLYNPKNNTNYIYFKQPQNDILHQLVVDFISNFEHHENLDSNTIKLGLINILLAADKFNPENTERFIYDYDSELVIKTYDYIDNNLADASLNQVAENLSTTNYTLSRIFKKKTGKTFIQELQNKRFERAYELITTTDITINDIAHQIGYDNLTFFYKKFDQFYGLKPNQLRVNIHKKKETI